MIFTKLIFVMVSFAAQGEKDLNQLFNDFLDKTHLTLGEYELKEGSSEGCLDGELKVTKLDDEFIIQLGAHPLVIGLGKANNTFSDGQCSTTTASSYLSKSINSNVVTSCKNNVKTKSRVIVKTIDESSFVYRKITRINGKRKVLNCHLVKVKK